MTIPFQVGDKAPVFNLPDASGQMVHLESLKGKWLVLYFYPKDNTPGCTVEALDFTALLPEFEALNAVIFGISPDTCESHQKFIAKKALKVNLISDTAHQMLEAYGVWQEKSMFGKKYMGVVRSTYLIDPEGVIRYIWPKVKVKGHAEAVKEKIAEMSS